MALKITILGCSAAIPVPDRNPTAQLLESGNHSLLLDCGEGTQMQLRKFVRKPMRISRISISHLHGDHFYGLIGLINSFHLLGREKELHLYGIPALKEIIDLQLLHSGTVLSYPLTFHTIDPTVPGLVWEDKRLTVSVIPMNHRVPTCGFLISEKPGKRRIRKDFARMFPGNLEAFEQIRNGHDYTDELGFVHKNHLVTDDPHPVKSYAYCSDTCYDESIVPLVAGCDAMYHEATFMQDKQADARAKYHSTAAEAATLAKKAGVKKLIIGHFSARYKDLSGMLDEARRVFPETILAEDGLRIEV